jgi:hypothetical protein
MVVVAVRGNSSCEAEECGGNLHCYRIVKLTRN